MRRFLASIVVTSLLVAVTGSRAADPPSVMVVLYSDLALNADLDQPHDPSDEGSCSYPFDCENIVRTAKALHRYFERTTDTGGSDVRMVAVQSAGGIGSSCASREADAVSLLDQFDPALVAHLGTGMECFVSRIAEAQVPTFGLNGLSKRTYAEHPDYVWTFGPNAQTQAALSASYVCRKLVGGRARFAGDPLLQMQQRRFGLIYPLDSARGQEFVVQAEEFQRRVKTQCGLTFHATEGIYAASTVNPGPDEAALMMARFKLAGITTVICHCVPVPTELTVPQMTIAAAAVGYLPEWYWDTSSFMDRASWQKLFQTKLPGGSFGWTWLWRIPELETTDWYVAYNAEEPGTTPNLRHIWSLYYTFWLTYAAIEAGNPTHDPVAIRDGLIGLTIGDESDPFGPLGSFGPDGPGPYSLVDTGMGFWWDETGTPPGGIPGQGCIRVSGEGLREHINGWPTGDDDLFLPEDPCTQAAQKVYVL